MAALYNTFLELGVEILAISTDSVYAHKVFASVSPSASKVQYPLVSDRTQKITRAYGVLREELGFPFRATFIVDPDGIVRFASLYPPEVGRNVNEIVRVIQGLQYEAATGLGIPAGWRPGLPGISKDFSFAGKI